MIAAGTTAAAFEHDRRAARARLTLWAAADSSILSRLSDASVAVDRCILVPVCIEGEIMALVPDVATLELHALRGSWRSSRPDWQERLASPHSRTW